MKILKRQIYKYFKKHYDLDVDFSTYSHVTTKIAKHVAKRIFEGDSFMVPAGLGYIYAMKRSMACEVDGEIKYIKSVNKQKTAELWKKNPELKYKKYIYHTNRHSDFYSCFIRFEKHRILGNKKRAISFKLSWSNRKEFSEHIIAGKYVNYETKKK
jgi:hypothetical protein